LPNDTIHHSNERKRKTNHIPYSPLLLQQQNVNDNQETSTDCFWSLLAPSVPNAAVIKTHRVSPRVTQKFPFFLLSRFHPIITGHENGMCGVFREMSEGGGGVLEQIFMV
jgi:hypothetical protein